LRVFLWFFLLVGAALIYLQLVGIPGRWATGLLKTFEQRGLFLDAERLSLDVRRGLLVEGCRVYDEASRRVPLLQADRIGLRLDGQALRRGRLRLGDMDVRGGLLRIGRRGPAESGPSLDLEELNGRLAFSPEGLEVSAVSVMCLGFKVTGRGRIDFEGLEQGRGSGRGVGALGDLLQDPPSWLSRLLDPMEQVSFEQPPSVEVEFVLRPGLEAASLVRVQGQGAATVVRGLAFDAWSFAGSLRGNRLTCRRALARAGDERLVASGAYDLQTRITEANLDSNLSPVYLEGLIPIGWRDRMDQTSLFFGGPVGIEVSLGPDVPERLLDAFSGRLDIVRAELREVWIERADVQFRLDGDRLVVPSFRGVIGRDARQGPAHGALAMDLETREVEGSLHAEFDWAAMLPVIGGGAARAIQLMQFNEKPPVTDVRFAGRPGGPDGMYIQGSLEGSSFLYRGTYVDHFRTDLCLTNHVLTLAPLRGEREEGYAEGLVAIDFKAKRVDLDLHSTADPPAAARTGGEKVARIVDRFRFNGPTEATMKGSVYYGTNGVTRIEAKARGEKIGLKWFTADEASFDFLLVGREALVSNFTCRAYGGEGGGVVRVAPDGDGWGFDADLKARGMAFGEVARLAMHRDAPPYPGALDMDGRFRGLLGEDFLHSLTATGQVSVSEAQLLQIPLFFGLSKGLSRIYPGLGFATQTDFQASFEVGDQQVFTDDARLEGTVLGLTAKGSYGLVKQDLEFKVEVRLLREQGVASSLVHLVTSPLSKLLQFDLRGTLEQPRWRPDNLPKELFLIFD
jgi:hypothetical protein